MKKNKNKKLNPIEEIKDLVSQEYSFYKDKSLPSISQIVKYIEEDKALLKDHFELIQRTDCPRIIQDMMINQEMKNLKQDIEFYEFGLQMAIKGYKLGKLEIGDEERKILDNLITKITSKGDTNGKE